MLLPRTVSAQWKETGGGGRESLIFFDMVYADLRTHQWLSTIFSFNRRKFLKYSKTQNHSEDKAKRCRIKIC